MKRLTDKLPTHQEKDRVLVQGRVDKALYQKVEKLLKSNGVQWQELIQAALEQYVEEQKGA